MAKVKWAVASHRRRKRLLKQTKGYRGARRNLQRKARETLLKAKVYRTRDRRTKRRTIRNLWVVRLNAAARSRGLTYSRLIAALRKADVRLDRKQLAELAVTDHGAFDQIVAQATGS